MSGLTSDDVKDFLSAYLRRKHEASGQGSWDSLSNDCDMLLASMIDSLGLLELVGALQEFAGVDIDFEALDPEQMTVVGPLCKFVSEQASKLA